MDDFALLLLKFAVSSDGFKAFETWAETQAEEGVKALWEHVKAQRAQLIVGDPSATGTIDGGPGIG